MKPTSPLADGLLQQPVRAAKYGVPLRDRLVACLPRYAPYASRLAAVMNLRDRLPGLARLSDLAIGLAAERSLPVWAARPFRDEQRADGEVVLFADTFNRYFEPDNLIAADTVLQRMGLTVSHATPADGGRPLCCGRTFLTAGLINEARTEMRRTAAILRAKIERGAIVVGLEPSCITTFRDEAPSLFRDEWPAELGEKVQLLEELIVARRADLPSRPLAGKALVHGHCHQKAFNAFDPVLETLRLIPGMAVEAVDSSCCGMAGAFGYQSETADISRAMAELSLLPAVREAGDQTFIVADGTSCRQQILDGTGRQAVHAAQILKSALQPV